MEVSLAKALKIKNRLAGKVSTLRNNIVKFNSQTVPPLVDIDLTETWKELDVASKNLVECKSAISRKTSEIADKLVYLQELKGFIGWIASIPIKNGEELQYGVQTPIVWKSHKSYNEIESLKNASQELIDKLQDEIDEFNATAKVTLSF